jgi:hypothetical protein
MAMQAYSDLHVSIRGQLVFARTDIGAKVVVWHSACEEVKMRRVIRAIGTEVLIYEPLLEVWNIERVAWLNREVVTGTRRRDGAVQITHAACEAGATWALHGELKRTCFAAGVAVGVAVAVEVVGVVDEAVESDADVGGIESLRGCHRERQGCSGLCEEGTHSGGGSEYFAGGGYFDSPKGNLQYSRPFRLYLSQLQRSVTGDEVNLPLRILAVLKHETAWERCLVDA